MNKHLKRGLYILLLIAIIVVAFLMFGSPKQIDVEPELNPEALTWENEENLAESEIINEESSPSFEEDVMKDLESFFGNTNWYENVGWEFGFTDGEIE